MSLHALDDDGRPPKGNGWVYVLDVSAHDPNTNNHQPMHFTKGHGPSNTWCTQGSGDVCPSAPELYLLGWASPMAVLSTANFDVGASKTFMLSPLQSDVEK